jgi:hypothetical protein
MAEGGNVVVVMVRRVCVDLCDYHLKVICKVYANTSNKKGTVTAMCNGESVTAICDL